MVHIQPIRKQSKKIVSIRIKGLEIITNNVYTGFQKTVSMYDESGKQLFATWVKWWAKDNYIIQISSRDFYILRSIRMI